MKAIMASHLEVKGDAVFANTTIRVKNQLSKMHKELVAELNGEVSRITERMSLDYNNAIVGAYIAPETNHARCNVRQFLATVDARFQTDETYLDSQEDGGLVEMMLGVTDEPMYEADAAVQLDSEVPQDA
jgi:hypothetical protein